MSGEGIDQEKYEAALEKIQQLQSQIHVLQGVADRANAAMLKHQKHNGALEIAIQEAHRATDAAKKELETSNRLKDEAAQVIRDILANELIHSDALLARARAVVAVKRKEPMDKCCRLDPSLRAPLPCVKERGHSGNHEDQTGCWW